MLGLRYRTVRPFFERKVGMSEHDRRSWFETHASYRAFLNHVPDADTILAEKCAQEIAVIEERYRMGMHMKDQFLKQWDDHETSSFMLKHLGRLEFRLKKIGYPHTDRVIATLRVNRLKVQAQVMARPLHIDAIPAIPVIARGLTLEEYLSLFSIPSQIGDQDPHANYLSYPSISLPEEEAYWLVNVHANVQCLGTRPDDVILKRHHLSPLTLEECLCLGLTLEQATVTRVHEALERHKQLHKTSLHLSRPEFDPHHMCLGSRFDEDCVPTVSFGFNFPHYQGPSVHIFYQRLRFRVSKECLPCTSYRI